MYVCKKMRLCEFLLSKGFKYIRTEPNKFRPGYLVWIFPQSPELWLAINEYYTELEKTLKAINEGNTNA